MFRRLLICCRRRPAGLERAFRRDMMRTQEVIRQERDRAELLLASQSLYANSLAGWSIDPMQARD